MFNALQGSISRGVTKGQGDAISGHRISGGAEWLRWPQKIPTMSHVHYSIQYIGFRKTSGSKLGALNLLLGTGTIYLDTPLSIWRLVPSRNPSTHFYVAQLRWRRNSMHYKAMQTNCRHTNFTGDSPETVFSF